MLVCNISARAPRAIIAVALAESAAADDVVTTGLIFAALVDDPASAIDSVDVYSGEIMLEAASAGDAVDAGYGYAAAISEAATSADATDASTSTGALTTWNPSDKSANITLTNANLTASASSATNSAVRGTLSVSSGKYYFEVTCIGTIANSGVGIATAAAILGSIQGTAALCAFINIAGNTVFVNGSVTGAGGGIVSSGQTVRMAVDMTNQRIWFNNGNGLWNNSGTADPATNVGGIDISAVFASAAAYPVVTFGSTGLNHTANFGPSFAYSVPTGFVHWP